MSEGTTGGRKRRSTIFIVRHGETEYNRKLQMQGRGIDAPLNKTGREQARAVAELLNEHEIDLVVSSSMMRARQTAEPIVKICGGKLLSYGDLDEMHFGDWEGKKYTDLMDEIKKVGKEWGEGNTSFPIPGGESPEEVLSRVDRRAKSILEKHSGKTIVFVIHGRVIRILLSHWTGIGLKNMEQIKHVNGAVNRIVWDGSGFDVIYMNKTEHLTGVETHD